MEATRKNLKNYIKGKEPLRQAVLQHPKGNDVYDFLKKNINRGFWVIPFSKWEKIQQTGNSKANDYTQDNDYDGSFGNAGEAHIETL